MTAARAGSRIAAGRQADRGWDERGRTSDNERTWAVIDALTAVAEEIGRTPAQVALRWLLRPTGGRPRRSSGARTLAQLEENLGAAGWQFDPADRARLDQVSDRPRPYPNQLLDDLREV